MVIDSGKAHGIRRQVTIKAQWQQGGWQRGCKGAGSGNVNGLVAFWNYAGEKQIARRCTTGLSDSENGSNPDVAVLEYKGTELDPDLDLKIPSPGVGLPRLGT